MDLHHRVKRNRTDSSSDDESDILQPPIESENDPIAADSAANSSVGQQPNSRMSQVEVDSLLERISLEVQRLNDDLKRKVSESPEFQRLKEELREKDEKLSETQLKLTECKSAKSEFVQQCYDAIVAKRQKELELDKCQNELENKSSEIVRLEAQLQQQQNLNDEQKRKSKEELDEAKSKQSQYIQMYNEESAKLTAVQQQFESEKGKNRQKDQQLVQQQKRLTDKSAEIHSKSGEIVELRQTGQSLQTELELKSDEILTIKSQVKGVLDAELNCSICSQPLTEAVVTVECGHTFCKGCIDEWMKSHQTCPFCRSECHRSAPVVAIQQLQAKLLSIVNGEQPIVTRSNGENLSSGNNNNSAFNMSLYRFFDGDEEEPIF